VASSANTNRPLAPAACGDIARALATKAAMSSEADGFSSGNDLALPAAGFCAAGTSLAGIWSAGSRNIHARNWFASFMWSAGRMPSMRNARRRFVLHRRDAGGWPDHSGGPTLPRAVS
jgi:hypothetical protein